jgi:hypothetical protein
LVVDKYFSLNLFSIFRFSQAFFSSASCLIRGLSYKKTPGSYRSIKGKLEVVPCKEFYMDRSTVSEEDNISSVLETISGQKRKHPLSFSEPQIQSTQSSVKQSRNLPDLVVEEQDYIEACLDGYFRTVRNPDYASYALIVGGQAHFYTPPLTQRYQPLFMPESTEPLTDFAKYFFQIPQYTFLKEVYNISADSQSPRYIGTTIDGKTLYGTHSINLTLEGPEFDNPCPAQMVSFYPLGTKQTKPYWGDREQISALFHFPSIDGPLKKQKTEEKGLSNNTEPEMPPRLDLGMEQKIKAQLEGHPHHFKAVKELDIDLESVVKRKEIKRRNPDQNTVMKRSSVQEIGRFLRTPLSQYLNPSIRDFLSKCEQAPLKGPGSMFYGQWRGEWLHLVGFGCTPMCLEPQVRSNLVSAAKSVNTEQMITEYILQGLAKIAFSLGYTNDDLQMKIFDSFFELIPTTEIASYLNFNTRIEMPSRQRAIETHQRFSPLQPPLFRHKADVGAGCVIFSRYLCGHQPDATIDITKKASLSMSGL